MAPVLFSIEWKRQVENDMASGERMQSVHDMLIQLRDPEFVAGSFLVPAVTQRWGHRGYDWYDAAAVDEVAFLAKVGLLATSACPSVRPPAKTARGKSTKSDWTGSLPRFKLPSKAEPATATGRSNGTRRSS